LYHESSEVAIPDPLLQARQKRREQQLDIHAENADARAMSYPGGKNGAGVYQKIINLMPPHEVYIEPFLGGGAIMRLKRPAALNIGIDLVPPSELPIQSFIAASDGAVLPGPLSSSSDKRSTIAHSSERRRSLNLAGSVETARTGDPGSLIAASDVAAFQFHQANGIDFLKRYRFTGKELVYCDPPYLMETRSGRKLYEFEMSSSSHRRFLRVAIAIRARVMISGYWSEMYAEALKGWNSIHFQTMTRGGTLATEWVWFNFPPPVELHDYQFLGENFRQRERIKRKKLRWTARLQRMPILERQSLLSAIAETAERTR
jgi:DNA adenine methylase